MTQLKKFMYLFFFVGLLMSCKNSDNINTHNDSTISTTDTVSNIKKTSCYLQTFNKDTTRISLTINGNNVNGKMDWIPFEKDGARGTLKGNINNSGELVLLYNYIIEGSNQSETKIMKIENGKLIIKKGELIDENNDGNLKYKDEASAVFSDTLDETDCTKLF